MGYIVTRQADTEQYCYIWSVTDTGLHYIETNCLIQSVYPGKILVCIIVYSAEYFKQVETL